MAYQTGSKKQVIFLIILAVVVAGFIVGTFLKDRQGEKKIIRSGDPAPEFRLPALDGRTIALADLRGKVVMVHFWATWCPPCVDELPTLEKLYHAMKNKEFELLAVSVDEAGADAVIPFMKKNKLELPVLLDPARKVSGLYGAFRFPETYILDRKGVVRHKVVGPRDWGDPATIAVMQGILDGRL